MLTTTYIFVLLIFLLYLLRNFQQGITIIMHAHEAITINHCNVVDTSNWYGIPNLTSIS